MAAVSIQETTVTPIKDGYAVELLVSERPPSGETTPAFVLTLRVELPHNREHSDRLPRLQLQALNAMVDALKPLMAGLYGS